MSQSSGPSYTRKKTSIFAELLNWPMVRKLESLAFLAMFIAMPLFAFRVADQTARQIGLQNSAHDLVKDIRKARQIAGEKQYDVTLEGRKGEGEIGPNYVIRHGEDVSETIALPKGVSILGEVTFHPDGLPLSPSTFEVHNENHSLSVDVDKQGVVSMP